MHPHHCIPLAQRVDLASRMIVHQGKYGHVSQLSRESNISRQSLYTLKSRVQEAMEREFRPKQEATEQKVERAVLLLFTEGQASSAGDPDLSGGASGRAREHRQDLIHHRPSWSTSPRVAGSAYSRRDERSSHR